MINRKKGRGRSKKKRLYISPLNPKPPKQVAGEANLPTDPNLSFFFFFPRSSSHAAQAHNTVPASHQVCLLQTYLSLSVARMVRSRELAPSPATGADTVYLREGVNRCKSTIKRALLFFFFVPPAFLDSGTAELLQSRRNREQPRWIVIGRRSPIQYALFPLRNLFTR